MCDAAAYPSTVCPISVRNVGSGSSDEQVKALLTNICENELKFLQKAFEDHPFLVEASAWKGEGQDDKEEGW